MYKGNEKCENHYSSNSSGFVSKLDFGLCHNFVLFVLMS